MKTRALVVLSLLGCLLATPSQAKTFVAVLWPMFGPLPAIGLVELANEVSKMPDVEVKTYVHQGWPYLVKDLDDLPADTRTVVIGYSLGANETTSVVMHTTRHIDSIIALQPSVFSWNPEVTKTNYGRYIEVYNPNKWQTFGGMGSKKLIAPNIEYVTNTDSHPGAQFNSDFRELVKSEVTRVTALGRDQIETAQASAKPQADATALAYAAPEPPIKTATPAKPAIAAANIPAPAIQTAAIQAPAIQTAAIPMPRPRPSLAAPVTVAKNEAPHVAKPPKPVVLASADPDQIITGAVQPRAAQLQEASFIDAAPQHHGGPTMAFLDGLSRQVQSGALSVAPKLTTESLMDYAKRTYHVHPDQSASNMPACIDHALGHDAGCSGG